MTKIPDWLCSEEAYEPKKDKALFINKSEKAFMKLMSAFKRNNYKTKAKDVNTSLRLFGVFILIILTSASQNFSFVIFMITLLLVRIAFLNSEKIKSWLKTVLPVALISILILAPSIFLGNPKTPLTILGKIFTCVTLVAILNLTSNANDITRSMKIIRIPDVVIFTFDLAVKYIVILGDACAGMLNALKIRSIGKNDDKKSSASGILGTVFIKAKMSIDDTSKAMECRGFNGEYSVAKEKLKLSKYDFINIALFVIVVCVFVYLEVIF